MRKISYALCFVAIAALAASCDTQEKFGTEELPKTALAFVIGDSQTKAADALEQDFETNMITLAEHDGQKFFLEETVTSLDDVFSAPDTKGTPAYTENVGDLYKSFSGVAYDVDDTKFTTPLLAEASFTYDGTRWVHTYTGDSEPWGDEKSLRFFMHMPETMSGVSNIAYTQSTISFDYDGTGTSLDTAAEQQDILFASRSVDKKDYTASGYKVLFYHALTGVKFAVNNQTDDDELTIKSVEFSGSLLGKGTCTITPYYGDWTGSGSNASGKDETKSASCVSWKPVDKSFYEASQDFTTVVGETEYKKGSYEFPDSFYEAGAENNLNDANASQTFWLMPQSVEGIKLTVTYEYNDKEYTEEIDFGEKAKKGTTYPEWKAGELRTYTLKVTSVGIDITDEVDGMKKSNVVITNSGSCAAFVRAAIIANWCDKDGNIVAPWTGSITPGADWVKASDGYYYYTKPVEAGKATGSALFDSYEYKSTDKPTYGVDVVKTADHLVMDISVQALKQGDYADDEYQKAWGTEAGVTF